MSPRAIQLMLTLILAALIIVPGVLTIQRKIPPNRFVGVRVRQTLEDPDLWYKANAFFGVVGVTLGIVYIAFNIGAFLMQQVSTSTYMRLSGLGLIVYVTLSLLLTYIHLRLLVR